QAPTRITSNNFKDRNRGALGLFVLMLRIILIPLTESTVIFNFSFKINNLTTLKESTNTR
ncbi:MAG: hypothetical protein ACI882_003333, partial [Reinekea sp.]